jgi:hypothetical protein
MARSEGLEPPTYKFVACCSIQLSYDRTLDRRHYVGIFIFPSTTFTASFCMREGYSVVQARGGPASFCAGGGERAARTAF